MQKEQVGREEVGKYPGNTGTARYHWLGLETFA